MDIPVSKVISKMEQAIARMKEAGDQPDVLSEQAKIIQAYSELLTEQDAGRKRGHVPPVNHATLEDMEKSRVYNPDTVPGKPVEPDQKEEQVEAYQKGKKVGDMAQGSKDKKRREQIYDDDDLPKSDSLLDF